MGKKVELHLLEKKMKIKNLTPEVDFSNRFVEVPDLNRPALQLSGYFEHFDSDRVQIIGYVEYTFVEKMTEERKESIYRTLLSYHHLPCVIFCRNLMPDELFLKIAREEGIPIFLTERTTSEFASALNRWLNEELAPCISIHGVLVDVYGVGVLIQGESGIGKSEAALELIRRGHRLVSDDVVEIRKVSDEILIGTAPDVTRHFIELRGIGIVDVKMLFGAMSVRETKAIDLTITLEDWNKEKAYDRLGLEDEYVEFLGNKVVCHQIPIRPGRNLAIIVETAAINHRQKKMGYNAVEELYKRIEESMGKRG